MAASYRKGVEWVALNDEPGELNPEVVEDFLTVTLLADLFGKARLDVAKDVVRYREKEAAREARADQESADLERDYQEQQAPKAPRRPRSYMESQPIQWACRTSAYDVSPCHPDAGMGYLGQRRRTCMDPKCGRTLKLDMTVADWTEKTRAGEMITYRVGGRLLRPTPARVGTRFNYPGWEPVDHADDAAVLLGGKG